MGADISSHQPRIATPKKLSCGMTGRRLSESDDRLMLRMERQVRAQQIGIGFHVVVKEQQHVPRRMFGPPITRRRGAGGWLLENPDPERPMLIPNLCNGFVLAAVGDDYDFEVVSGRRLIAKSDEQSAQCLGSVMRRNDDGYLRRTDAGLAHGVRARRAANHARGPCRQPRSSVRLRSVRSDRVVARHPDSRAGRCS